VLGVEPCSAEGTPTVVPDNTSEAWRALLMLASLCTFLEGDSFGPERV
jgi:hypothetical protein